MNVRNLERSLYTTNEAARLLEIPAATLRRWLEGFSVKGHPYPPVIRTVPTGETEVTWAEFVEAGFLREYRMRASVSLQRLRPFIDVMREREVPYPLAQLKPIVHPSKDLLVELHRLQQELGLPESMWLVWSATGQLAWREPMKAFLDKVEFDPDAGIALRIHPLGGGHPVVIDPDVAFGVPQIRGVRTEMIAEALATGESIESLRADYSLTHEELGAAIQWELRLTRPQAQAA